MGGFLRCFAYLSTVGIGGFFAGRALSSRRFNYDRFPYRPFAFEREGTAYEALGISRWKEKLPDMSRIFPRLMLSKKLPKRLTAETVRGMIQETCVAETIHALLCIAGIGCIFIWKGPGGLAVYVPYVLLGNVPYIMIQRCNRPKLVRILNKLNSRRGGNKNILPEF